MKRKTENINKPKYVKHWEEPEKIPKKILLKKEEVRDKIANEGLGFCIFEYIMPNQIEDEELRNLWAKAKKAMRDVKIYVYEK